MLQKEEKVQLRLILMSKSLRMLQDIQEHKLHQQHHFGVESSHKRLLNLLENSHQSDNGYMLISLKPYQMAHKIELFKENNMMIILLFLEETS